MNLRHIEVFHAVYVHGSVSAAARALNVSQPSVSKVLRHAEDSLGLELFQRVKGRLVPTQDAHSLFAEVADIHDRMHTLRQASRNLRDGRGSTLRISALPSLGLGAIPRAVAGFLARHSTTLFDLQTLHHDEIVRKLYERETDVAISYQVPADAPVAHTIIGEGELVVLYREEEMPDAPPRLPLDSLRDRRFISPVQAGPLGRLLSGELMRQNIVLDEIISARTTIRVPSICSTTPGRRATTTAPESRATTSSMPVPTSGASDWMSGTACFCMLEPIRARLASSFSRNGISEAATETTCCGETSIRSTCSLGSRVGSPLTRPGTRSSTISPFSSLMLAWAMTCFASSMADM